MLLKEDREPARKPTDSSLLYRLAKGHSCMQVGDGRYFCQEAVFRLSRLTERRSTTGALRVS
jgi:hypothetical protein